jgi:hypothetical protein
MDEERQSFPPNELLIRIDERTRMIAEEIKILREQMITRAEFGPVRLIAFGLVALIMTMVLTAVIAQVVTGR